MTDQTNGSRGRLFVVTGAPGSGKSAILEALQSHLACVAEPAREVLADERASGGTGTPDQDPSRFAALLLERSIAKHDAAVRSGEVTLFDRGVPDCAAYAVMLGTDPAPAGRAAGVYRYHDTVLLLEPWEEIYTTDDERLMSFADTLPFHDAIVDAYERAGYSLSVVPRGDVAERTRVVGRFVHDRAAMVG